jgi:excinuclease ABC subunit C
MEKGFQYIQSTIKDLTQDPGCYLMRDHEDQIFYIGKAKNLRARLRSYFQGSDTRIFVQYLEQILARIEVLVVHNDIEALILERELIKKHKPRFNILLRDDKNYLLLKLKRKKLNGRKKDEFPKLEIVRKTLKDHARYFGPYPSANNLRTTVELINKYFLLRTCPDKIIENRMRPCIQYQIGRCPAPCVFDVPDYDQEVDNVILFLSGQYQEVKARLQEKMLSFAEGEQFEAAAKVRDQINAIKTSLTSQVVKEVNHQRNQDIIGFARRGPEVEIVQILIRHGSWHKSHNYSFSNQPLPSEEILRAFMHQAYGEAHDLPQDIIIPLPIVADLEALTELLESKVGRKITIFFPHKGKNKRLLELAHKNAVLALEDRVKKIDSAEQALESLRSTLGLAMKPRRIECIDISLIQGAEPVGSCVVFINGQPDKSLYRLFKIKTVQGMDDFAMINEVVSRRIKRGIEEKDLPDLLLIDGGQGQLNAALKAIEEHNLLVTKDGFYVAGIAKARALKELNSLSPGHISHSDERLFVPGAHEPLVLHAHTFERYLVERIRDEAHRFALSAHRRSRAKRTLSSELKSIPGIGQKRALALLKFFGSVKKIREASPEALSKVARINIKRAQEVLEFLATST